MMDVQTEHNDLLTHTHKKNAVDVGTIRIFTETSWCLLLPTVLFTDWLLSHTCLHPSDVPDPHRGPNMHLTLVKCKARYTPCKFSQ